MGFKKFSDFYEPQRVNHKRPYLALFWFIRYLKARSVDHMHSVVHCSTHSMDRKWWMDMMRKLET